MTEPLNHFGYQDILPDVLKISTVISAMRPYITSQFMPRKVSDRHKARPEGAKNFALIGQFVEIPQGIVLTVENSARGAMIAAYSLTGLDKTVPKVFQTFEYPSEAIPTLLSAMNGKAF